LKLVLEFTLKNESMPLEYRRVFMHFLKTCLANANDGKYYDSFYEKGKSKNFTFSMFFDNPKYTSKGIDLASKNVKVVFSILEEMEGYLFYSSFLEKRHTKITLENNNYMVLDRVRKVNEQEVHNCKMLVKMNSPLLVRKHDRENNRDQYYYFEEEEFKKELSYNLNLQLQREGFAEKLIENLKVIPIKCKKVVVKHYNCQYAGTLGNFLIEGNPKILNYLLKAGVSSRRSEGFGHAELLTDDL
jgi:CRISPR-associated endoribonuclease Cas6